MYHSLISHVGLPDTTGKVVASLEHGKGKFHN